MRINKFFTEQGHCSRREADRLIAEKRVKINGRIAVLGDQVSHRDVVQVDDKKIKRNFEKVYIMYNKPRGVVCTTDRSIEGNIIDAIKHPLRIFTIGRLDKDSTGLIFLTNDGDIVNKILRTQYGNEKEYAVEINKPVTEHFLLKMINGVHIGDYVTKKCKVEKTGHNKFNIVLTEGKNRQIRRMCEVMGATVKTLHRVRIMNIKIGSLKNGAWVDIPQELLQELMGTLKADVNIDLSMIME